MFRTAKEFLRDSTFQSFVYHFANQMTRLEGKESEELLIASGLLGHEIFKGNVCVDLQKYSGKRSKLDFPENETELQFPDLESWLNVIRESKCVGKPGDSAPLILEKNDDWVLYTNRYWQYEENLARVINEKVKVGNSDKKEAGKESLIDCLFPIDPKTPTEKDLQKTAALTALQNPFTVITGGPGTGKTAIVVKIMALILEDYLKQGRTREYRFHLVAPTGKAASRLKESIIDLKIELLEQKLISPELFDLIKEDTSTIHRLLGYIPGSVYFRFNQEQPLPLDCLVVDEASMVDLALMSKLLEAVPRNARIILLGDENQLASVEAGSVLTDICLGLRNSQAHQHNVVTLSKSHRFSSEKGIGKLSRIINEGKGKQAFQLLEEYTTRGGKDSGSNDGAIFWEEVPKPTGLATRFQSNFLLHYSNLLQSGTIEKAFSVFEQFIILCALRGGPYGVEQINQLVENTLIRHKLIEKGKQWYSGKPVLIVNNDYQLKLFNGDIGITFKDSETGKLRIFFKKEGGFRTISPYRLSNYETAYALTVHKSQGSEFNQVLLILPPEDNKILTKELLYTGITRAKRAVTLMVKKSVFIRAVNRSIERFSGLEFKLSKNGTSSK